MTVESIHRPVEKIVESQDRFKASDGFQLFYRHWSLGSETERVILGLHGNGWHSGQFMEMGAQLPIVVPGTELYAFDQRGYGNSVEDGFQRGDVSSFKRFLRDVDEVAESLRKNHSGEKFYLFGHSLGCLESLRFAASHPDSVDGLILAGPGVIPGKGVKPPLSLILRVMFLRIFSPEALIDSAKYRSKAFRQSEEAASVQEDPLSAHSKYSSRYLFGISRLFRKTLTNARGVRVPTLILQGEADGLAEPAGAARLLEALSANDKSLKTFPAADHHFFDSLPPRRNSTYDDATRKQVFDAIADWLRAH
jgi:acylglycerol lipase